MHCVKQLIINKLDSIHQLPLQFEKNLGGKKMKNKDNAAMFTGKTLANNKNFVINIRILPHGFLHYMQRN